MNATRIEAPSDVQLVYIAGLCEERGLEPPTAIYSKADASECIAAILARQYDPRRYMCHTDPGAHNEVDYYDPDDDDVPF